MSIIKKLNHLRRDLLQLARRQWNTESGRGKNTSRRSYRTYDTAAVARPTLVASSAMQAETLNIVEVVRETEHAVSVFLARPDGKPIAFTPGMFFTVVLTVDGQEYRRAYSISSAAQNSQRVAITIKHISGGKVSSWLHEHAVVGGTLRVLGPSGSFVVRPVAGHARHILLVGAGSGITPLMSMAQSLLQAESDASVFLLYANRSRDEAIFFDALNALQVAHSDRFRLRHVLKHSPRGWRGGKGRLELANVGHELEQLLGATLPERLQVYLCGPEQMMTALREELHARGVDDTCIHQERFTPASASAGEHHYEARSFTVESRNGKRQGQVMPGQTLLEAGLAAGADMPFSCTLGGCGQCRIRVQEGEVDMAEPNCLLPHERDSNYALACIARPLTPVTFRVEPPLQNQ